LRQDGYRDDVISLLHGRVEYHIHIRSSFITLPPVTLDLIVLPHDSTIPDSTVLPLPLPDREEVDEPRTRRRKKGKTRKGRKTYLWLITTKSPMTKSQPLQPNRKLNITRPHNILYFEFRKFSIKS
jgi:hypothetical protein